LTATEARQRVFPPDASALPEALLSRFDPLGWGPATAAVAQRAASHPVGVAKVTGRLLTTLARLPGATLARSVGATAHPPIEVDKRDRRFTDPAWESNPAFFALRQTYLATCAFTDALLEAGRAGDLTDAKAAQFVHLLQDAFAPTNFPFTNPDVLVKAFQTGGLSVVKGALFAAGDIRNGGRPVKVDHSAFTLGKNLAATPGKVVYRNELIELIQYASQTDEVHEVPLLASPPWINKYYVMDLAPRRSFLEWAVQHGHSVFTLSYRNPEESMRGITLDDYLLMGPVAGLEAVSQITGIDRVDVVGLCLGGAMAAMLAAYLAAEGSGLLGSLTLLNTMLDYRSPGELGAMVDQASLDRLDKRMAETGFLDSKDMALTFDLLRPNDLIFNYVVSRWLKGEPPSAFDILAWNDDSTRMPAAMHATYLRSLYGANLLARGKMSLAGEVLDLGVVDSDSYIVGAVNDHIVPWHSSYASQRLLGGEVRYVLSSGGHVAGIVNPPSPKAWFEALDPEPDGAMPDYPVAPERWRRVAGKQPRSWWEDWTEWSAQRAGPMRKPPRMGSRKHRPLADAPGTYVLG
jgi:poly[(R)-3-hydroxyalkanoate] polymerase subunit PhaC